MIFAREKLRVFIVSCRDIVGGAICREDPQPFIASYNPSLLLLVVGGCVRACVHHWASFTTRSRFPRHLSSLVVISHSFLLFGDFENPYGFTFFLMFDNVETMSIPYGVTERCLQAVVVSGFASAVLSFVSGGSGLQLFFYFCVVALPAVVIYSFMKVSKKKELF